MFRVFPSVVGKRIINRFPTIFYLRNFSNIFYNYGILDYRNKLGSDMF